MRIKELFRDNSIRTENIKPISKESSNRAYSKAYRVDEIEKNLKEKNFTVSDLGAYTFRTTLFKNSLRTPHYEIQRNLENYEDIPNINSGVNQIVLFITGNEIKITSKDKYTNDWFGKWLEQRDHVTESVQNIITQCEVCGNSWIEPVWDTITGGIKYMNDFKVSPDSSRVYYNLAQVADKENEFWIYQVPYIFRKYGDMVLKQYLISYVKNGIAWQETVYGVGLKEDDLIHMKIGLSRYGYYGRSYLASTINSSEIITQILKNYAIASRFMAFGKKIFSVGDENDRPDPTELKTITDILNSPEDEEHVIINKKIGSTEITPTQFNEMPNGLEYNRKEVSSGLTPAFMTPWSDTVTYASSTNAKIPFELSLENKRNKYIKLLNKNILKHVMKQDPKLKDATFEFGEVTLDDSKDTQESIIQLYNNNAITLNQLLKGLGYEIITNGDLFQAQWNALLQQKYGMDENEYKQFDNPYIKNSEKNKIEENEEQQTKSDQSEVKEESPAAAFQEKVLEEKNKDVKDSTPNVHAKKMYNWLKKSYNDGYRDVIWRHNKSENPRIYHINKHGKMYKIKDMVDKKIEWMGWANRCLCTGELVEETKIKKKK